MPQIAHSHQINIQQLFKKLNVNLYEQIRKTKLVDTESPIITK